MATTTRSIHRIALLTALGTALTVSGGCGGPTKAGLEARADARDRMSLVNAQISHDQAKRAFEVGQFDRALRDISHAIDRYPHVPAYHLLHGRILLETHRLEQALAAFDRAIKIVQEEGGEPSRASGGVKGAGGGAIAGASGGSQVAEVASGSGGSGGSGRRLASNVETLAQAHYFAGIVHQRWSNHEAAHQRYLTAATLDESNAQYLLATAESMIALELYDEAHELVAPRLAYFENNAAMRHLLGHIALLRGDPNYASQLFERARLLNPDDPMLAEELAWAQYGAGKYAHCLESVQQLAGMTRLSTGEKRLDLMHLEARCLMHLERHSDARNLYMELSRRSPADPDVWIELGAVAWELGDLRRVAEAATRVIALAPDRYEGYALRGVHARAQDRLTDAEQFFRQASMRAPDHALPHLLLAQALEQSNQHEEALMLYAKVISMFPNNREAFMLFNRLSQSPSLKQLTVVNEE